MRNLIYAVRKEHVVFISGDVHYAELSKDCTSEYPLYDLTSSGISESWGFAAPNVHREDGPIMDNNFGVVRIRPWRKKITFSIYSKQGLSFQRIISLDELEFK
jgi:alkaline phosphatase D